MTWQFDTSRKHTLIALQKFRVQNNETLRTIYSIFSVIDTFGHADYSVVFILYSSIGLTPELHQLIYATYRELYDK